MKLNEDTVQREKEGLQKLNTHTTTAFYAIKKLFKRKKSIPKSTMEVMANPKIIIICATGRSGSTTLQRIINTIEESNINGENWGAINNLLECYMNVKKTKRPGKYNINSYVEGKTKIKPSFYNCYDLKNVKNNIKNTILSIITNDNSKKVIGFKEIRYFGITYLIDEFIELFPNTKVICHIDDDLERQSKSRWWKNNDNSKKGLEEYNNQLINYYIKSKGKGNCYLSYMKNLFIIKEIKKMFEFLGEELNEKKYNYIINNPLELVP